MLPQLRHVPLLVAPLDPAGRRAQRVHQDERVHPLRVLERVPDHDVAAQAEQVSLLLRAIVDAVKSNTSGSLA